MYIIYTYMHMYMYIYIQNSQFIYLDKQHQHHHNVNSSNHGDPNHDDDIVIMLPHLLDTVPHLAKWVCPQEYCKRH